MNWGWKKNILKKKNADFSEFYEASIGEWKKIEEEAKKVLKEVEKLNETAFLERIEENETVYMLKKSEELTEEPLNESQASSAHLYLSQIFDEKKSEKKRRLATRRTTLEKLRSQSQVDYEEEGESVSSGVLDLNKAKEMRKEPLNIERQVTIRFRTNSFDSFETFQEETAEIQPSENEMEKQAKEISNEVLGTNSSNELEKRMKEENFFEKRKRNGKV